MLDFAAIGSIFGLAFFYFWPAIPAGLALGLSPLVVILTTSLSYIAGVAAVTLFGTRLRDWILQRLGKKATLDPESVAGRIWTRFGVPGLGLIAPMTVGSQIGAAVGLMLNARPRQLFIWMSIGAIAWGSLLTALVSLGVLGVQSVVN